MSRNKIKISACIITYNQEEFISKCLEGAINQNLDCSYEIVISDDKSTDNTLSICKKYKKEYPNLIRIIDRKVNLGVSKNWFDTIEQCKGEYVAICEGDDYWTDPLKLKRQVDFLDNNPSFSACFTNAKIINSIRGEEKLFLNFNENKILKAYDIITGSGGIFPTAALTFRNGIDSFPSFVFKTNSADYALSLMLVEFGDFYYSNEVTNVYRIHESGVFSAIREDNTERVKIWFDNIQLLNSFNTYTNKKYNKIIQRFHSKISLKLLVRSNSTFLSKNFLRVFPNLSLRHNLSFLKYNIPWLRR